jgi:hypothetical protein
MYHFHHQCTSLPITGFFQALRRLVDRLGADHFQVLILKAEIELAQQDYPAALSRYVCTVYHGIVY